MKQAQVSLCIKGGCSTPSVPLLAPIEQIQKDKKILKCKTQKGMQTFFGYFFYTFSLANIPYFCDPYLTEVVVNFMDFSLNFHEAEVKFHELWVNIPR